MKAKKQILSLIVFIFIRCSLLFASEPRTIALSNVPSTTRLFNNNQYGFEVKFEVGRLDLKEVATKAGTFDELSIEGYNFTPRIGEPKLPMQSKFLAVPIGATVNFEIMDRKVETLDKTNSLLLHPVIPTQRSVSKSEDPSLVPFEINDALYHQDSFTKNELFYVEEIGYLYDSSNYLMGDPKIYKNIVLFPLNEMDGKLIETKPFGVQRSNYDFIFNKTKKIISNAENNNQEYFTLLFHDRYFSDEFPVWKKWYIEIIKYLISEGHTFINFENATELLKMNKLKN